MSSVRFPKVLGIVILLLEMFVVQSVPKAWYRNVGKLLSIDSKAHDVKSATKQPRRILDMTALQQREKKGRLDRNSLVTSEEKKVYAQSTNFPHGWWYGAATASNSCEVDDDLGENQIVSIEGYALNVCIFEGEEYKKYQCDGGIFLKI